MYELDENDYIFDYGLLYHKLPGALFIIYGYILSLCYLVWIFRLRDDDRCFAFVCGVYIRKVRVGINML